MKRQRVLVLVHEDLVPPDSKKGLSEKEIQPWKTEYDVGAALRSLGHDVDFLGVSDDLIPIRRAVEDWKPHIVFNQLVEFQDVGDYQVHVTSYLELLKVPYTGCNPRGLLLARDKALAKKILRYHRVLTPAFHVVQRGRKPRRPRALRFPLIVKSVDEDAALGVSQASIVSDDERLGERVAFIHENVGSDALVEEYIEGRELTIGVIGNERLRTLPVWEMTFDNLPDGSEPIATAKVKWDLAYQKRIGMDTVRARLPKEQSAAIAKLAKRVYRALSLSGFSRLDLRLADGGRVFVLEANAMPDLAADEDFAASAEAAGLEYHALIQTILRLGRAYRPPWGRR